MIRRLAMIAGLLAVSTSAAGAAEIKVLSAGAMKSIVTELGEAFKQETGEISEILSVKGVTLIGPLPRELQQVTVYSGGLAAKAAQPEAARAFLASLTRPAFKPKLAAAGLDYRE